MCMHGTWLGRLAVVIWPATPRLWPRAIGPYVTCRWTEIRGWQFSLRTKGIPTGPSDHAARVPQIAGNGRLVDDGDNLVRSDRIGVGIVDDADPTSGSVATAVDNLPRNVGIAAHAPEEPCRRLPDRHPFVPAKKVELSE